MSNNFLLGRGELLSFPISKAPSFGEKTYPYTFEESYSRLVPQFNSISSIIDDLPTEACPDDYAVELITLNPSFIAKSYYPNTFLSSLGLQAIGSRNTFIKPKKWSRKSPPEETVTTEIYIAGSRKVLRSIPSRIKEFDVNSNEILDFCKIEAISLANPLSPTLNTIKTNEKNYFEIGVHLLPFDDKSNIERSFIDYAYFLDVKLYEDLSFRAGNLWFIPGYGRLEDIKRLSQFVFVRIVRPMPKLRSLPSTIRTSSALSKVHLPEAPAIAQDIRVAILDGGMPSQHKVQRWLNQYIKSDPESADIDDYNDHGLAVSSAFLFGPLTSRETASQPYASLTHIRVLDEKSLREDPLLLYRTLGFIEEVLLSRQYQFINLSLGPDLPIEDQDVHAWTSVIDEKLSDGQTFMAIAVGNNGDLDQESGNARIQVPSDCVNAISVGAASSLSNDWCRASYSAKGPGRCPGIVKPDLMAFGGETTSYFHVLSRGNDERIIPQIGTSFASPVNRK